MVSKRKTAILNHDLIQISAVFNKYVLEPWYGETIIAGHVFQLIFESL